MDSNGITNNTGLAIAFIALLVFGIAYNAMVERFQKHTQHYTAEFVVFGVLITILVSGFFIGWNNAGTVLVLFIASGLPMMIGSWIRAARDEEAAKKIQKETMK
jgi:4-hydroxybenzoate polyprenyltransferase